ncbi:MAG: phosphoadenylyl-sulfate reductase [Chitinophagaceae bacterium]
MTFEQLSGKIHDYKSRGQKIFTTSSFQTHSIVLLHMLSRIDKSIPVYFVHTGYHFPETLNYRDEITSMLGLNLKNIFSSTSKINQRDPNGKLLFASDPDYCCYLNKVAPLETILAEYDVWINGVRADQSDIRKGFKEEEKAKFGTIRFHPMLDWNNKMIYDYLKQYNIPRHPLEEKGYFTIGCEPCTRKWDAEMKSRDGRWYGLKKTECGLNTELVTK